MSKTVFMFPGQGSQYVGMWEKLGAQEESQKGLLELADRTLGFSISRIIIEGPQDLLTQTYNAQPALLLAGVAAAAGMERMGHSCDVVMGHSLGEYTALVFAGSLSLEDGLRLVRLRGELMAKAVDKTPGRMAAVIGAELEQLQALVDEISKDAVLEITNFNAPGQVVLSGENRAIELAVTLTRERRVGRAIPLDVSAPFHSSMMLPIAEEFRTGLAQVSVNAPQKVFIDNVTGEIEANPQKIREKLVKQLTSPVLWEKSVLTASGLKATKFVECGPKNVLSGLVKRITKGVEILSSEAALNP